MARNSLQIDPEEYKQAIKELCGCEKCKQINGRIEVAYKEDEDIPLCDEAFKRWCFEGLQESDSLNKVS